MPDNDPDYYRARAAKARQLANAAHDPAVRKIHAKMADDYESLAAGREQILQQTAYAS